MEASVRFLSFPLNQSFRPHLSAGPLLPILNSVRKVSFHHAFPLAAALGRGLQSRGPVRPCHLVDLSSSRVLEVIMDAGIEETKHQTADEKAGVRSIGRTSRRGFLRALGLSTTAFGMARFWPPGRAAAAAGMGGDGPFSWASLAERGATLTEALGLTDIAQWIRSDCGIPGTCDGQAVISSVRKEDQSIDRWNKFFEIFPSGEELARIAYLLSNTDWVSPKFPTQPLVAGGRYLANSGDQRRGISLLAVSGLPSTLPSWELLVDASVGPKVWQTDPDRAQAIVAATTIVGLASLDPLSQLERTAAPPPQRSTSPPCRAHSRVSQIPMNWLLRRVPVCNESAAAPYAAALLLLVLLASCGGNGTAAQTGGSAFQATAYVGGTVDTVSVEELVVRDFEGRLVTIRLEQAEGPGAQFCRQRSRPNFCVTLSQAAPQKGEALCVLARLTPDGELVSWLVFLESQCQHNP
jgi:hypothetical protein